MGTRKLSHALNILLELDAPKPRGPIGELSSATVTLPFVADHLTFYCSRHTIQTRPFQQLLLPILHTTCSERPPSSHAPVLLGTPALLSDSPVCLGISRCPHSASAFAKPSARLSINQLDSCKHSSPCSQLGSKRLSSARQMPTHSVGVATSTWTRRAFT